MAKDYQTYCFFSQTYIDTLIILVKNGVFFLQHFIIHEDNVLEYTDNNYVANGGRGGVRQMLTGLTNGGEGLGKC